MDSVKLSCYIILPFIDGNLASMIAKCKNLLDLAGYNERKHVSWNKRMSSLNESWVKSRSTIAEYIISAEKEPGLCAYCSINKAFIRCHKCGLSFHQCHTCDEMQHIHNPFHNWETWNGKFFEAVSPMEKWNAGGKIIDNVF